MDVIETDTADVQVNSAGATSYVNNYKIMNMLGEGTFSKVYLCQNEAGAEFALKVINKSILKRKREYKRVDGKLVLSNAFQKVQKEVAIMKKLAHSNLVRLYEVIDSPADDKLFLVLELIRGGQIMYWDDKKFRYFARNTPTGILAKDAVRECLRNVVAALDFLHRNQICHRDIKPENILLSGDQFKLADFGVAYMNEGEPSVAARAGDAAALKLRSTEGTYHFLAPECTTGDEYDPYQVDVWALGVTMFTLLVGTLPFGTSVASLSDVMTSIREDPLILPLELDSECAQLLTQLMEKNPNLRITIPQLKTHPWLSGAGGDLYPRQSGLEVIVTQQEIEAAFTPVNNFILVMKLKMKMSTRLNKARKSLASNGNGALRAEAVPVAEHVPVSSSQAAEDAGSEPKTTEMAPSEQPRIMADRLQRRSSRLAESISDTIGSFATTLTRRKTQLGAIPPVFDGAAPTPSSPVVREDSPGKAEINGRSGVLIRQMSRRNSRSVQSSIPDVPQRTDSAQKARVLSSEEQPGDDSPAKSDADSVTSALLTSSRSNFVVSLSGSTSPGKREETASSPLPPHRLTKRKSSSFKGLPRTIEIPEGAPTRETASPTSKKRRESVAGNSDPVISAQNAAQPLDSASPVSNEATLSDSLLARRNSMSFRALAATPELSPCSDGTTNVVTTPAARVTSGAGSSISPQLARRLSRRNSRSFRGVATTPDASRSAAKEPGEFPTVVTRKEHSVKLDAAALESNANDAVHSPIKAEATSPASRRDSMSVKALVSMPEVAGDAGKEHENVVDVPTRAHDPGFTTPNEVGDNDSSASSESKPPGRSESKSSPGLLARRLSLTFRMLPLKVDVTSDDDSSSDTLVVASPVGGVDELHSLKMNTSRSPPGSPKLKTKVESDVTPPQTLPSAALPVLEIHSPISSPVTSPRKATDVDKNDINAATPRRRASSPAKEIESTRRPSPVKVTPLLRKRSSSLRLDVSSDGDENEDPAHTAASDTSPTPTADPTETPFADHPPPGSPSERRATFSTKPASPHPEEDKSLQSPHRKLHHNRLTSAFPDGDDPDSALTRKSSLARVLDACLPTEAPTAATETEAQPLTPTRRHPVHVPPLDQPARPSRSSMTHGRHYHISPLESVGSKSSPSLDKPRKSLVQAQDSLRSLLVRGQSSVRLNILDEKRGPHYDSDETVGSVKSKVCAVM
ncbi:hypothetical protein PRIC2_006214 [Phytophthora ramorum]